MRVVGLVRSIEANMVGNIPFVIACPKDDVDKFKSALPNWVEIVDESSFARFEVNDRLGVWREQQLIKMMFGVEGRFDNFYILDSDSYFLRPFSVATLFGEEDQIPFTVSPNYYRFRASDSFTTNLALGDAARPGPMDLDLVSFRSRGDFFIDEDLINDAKHAARRPSEVGPLIGRAFGRTDQLPLYFMPTPIPWNSEILIDMWATLALRGITFSDLLKYAPWEALWYGNWAIQRFDARLSPREPEFLHFEADEEIAAARAMGITERGMSANFLGVTLAARHQQDVRFDPSGIRTGI